VFENKKRNQQKPTTEGQMAVAEKVKGQQLNEQRQKQKPALNSNSDRWTGGQN
jgi:hypothetical protein